MTDGTLTNEKWQIVLGCLEDMGEKKIAEELSESLQAEKEKWSCKTEVDVLMKYFGMEDKYDVYSKIDHLFAEWDGFTCKICGDTIPNDGKEMILHMSQHTLEEIKKEEDEE